MMLSFLEIAAICKKKKKRSYARLNYGVYKKRKENVSLIDHAALPIPEIPRIDIRPSRLPCQTKEGGGSQRAVLSDVN